MFSDADTLLPSSSGLPVLLEEDAGVGLLSLLLMIPSPTLPPSVAGERTAVSSDAGGASGSVNQSGLEL